MATKDKSDRIISLVRGAIYVEVIARIDGELKEFRFLKDRTDREIRNIVLDTKTPPLLNEDNIMAEDKAAEQAELEKAKQTIPTPPVVAKNRASRQDMINALRAAGVTGVNVANRNALETAYAKLQGGEK